MVNNVDLSIDIEAILINFYLAEKKITTLHRIKRKFADMNTKCSKNLRNIFQRWFLLKKKQRENFRWKSAGNLKYLT